MTQVLAMLAYVGHQFASAVPETATEQIKAHNRKRWRVLPYVSWTAASHTATSQSVASHAASQPKGHSDSKPKFDACNMCQCGLCVSNCVLTDYLVCSQEQLLVIWLVCGKLCCKLQAQGHSRQNAAFDKCNIHQCELCVSKCVLTDCSICSQANSFL